LWIFVLIAAFFLRAEGLDTKPQMENKKIEWLFKKKKENFSVFHSFSVQRYKATLKGVILTHPRHSC